MGPNRINCISGPSSHHPTIGDSVDNLPTIINKVNLDTSIGIAHLRPSLLKKNNTEEQNIFSRAKQTRMTVSVHDIAAMSDTELAQFIVQNRTSDGDFDLPIHDWDNLSRDERDHLAERLK